MGLSLKTCKNDSIQGYNTHFDHINTVHLDCVQQLDRHLLVRLPGRAAGPAAEGHHTEGDCHQPRAEEGRGHPHAQPLQQGEALSVTWGGALLMGVRK